MRLRQAIVPLALLAFPPQAAVHAEIAGTFTGTAHLPNFGSDAGGNGTFSGTFNGVIGKNQVLSVVVNMPMDATFTYVQPNPTCPLTGLAFGRAEVAYPRYTIGFVWIRIGATAIVTGTDGGVGTAAFQATTTVPCPREGQHVTATVAGVYQGGWPGAS